MYCPHWMDEEVWREGLRDNWKPIKKKNPVRTWTHWSSKNESE